MNYASKSYCMTVSDATDSLTVGKVSGSDWSLITMDTNGETNGKITLRGKEMAEALYLLLGRLLSKEDA